MSLKEAFHQLAKEVGDLRSEAAQVSLIARVLVTMGHSPTAARNPDATYTSVDRSTFRVYLWRDTPFGDHLILGTGPSFEPRLELARDVPSSPEAGGIYLRTVPAKDLKTLAQAGRALGRMEKASAKVARRAAERQAQVSRQRAVRAPVAPPAPPKPEMLMVAAQRRPVGAISRRMPTEGEWESPSATSERLRAMEEATKPKRAPAPRKAKPSFDAAAAAAQAEQLIAALRARR